MSQVTSPIDNVNYGPLSLLTGTWDGGNGMDIAPEPDGQEANPFYEQILFEAIGEVTNAEQQTLAALRYHQVVRRKSNDKVFHNEIGYWLWDAAQGLVMQTLTIPRGVSLIAGVAYKIGAPGEPTVLEVRAAIDDAEWTIAQSPFMLDNAKTIKFSHTISVDQDTLIYSETTVVEIYGKRFDHSDGNTLQRS